jgi:predicted dehydrogenase/threonine dehydrogenase-like Zn-dependent dehydrogenase
MLQLLQSFRSGEVWLADVPAPCFPATGALVRTHASLVSAGTERMLLEFGRKSLVGKALSMPEQTLKVLAAIKSEGLISALAKVEARLDRPVALGYSSAGVVEQVGAECSGLHCGERVACGGAQFAHHAEWNAVSRTLMFKLPPEVSFEDGAFAAVGAVALQAVRQADSRVGESVGVLGLGLVGLLCVQILKASGCRVLGYDPDSLRVKRALDLGTDVACSDGAEDAAGRLTDGRGLDAVVIAAAASSSDPVRLAGEMCRPRGVVVSAGLTGLDVPRDLFYRKELTLRLSMSYGPGRYDPSYEEAGRDYPLAHVRWTEQRNMQAFLDLVAAGKVKPSALVTHRFAIKEALKAYELLLAGQREPHLGLLITYPDAPAAKAAPAQRIDYAAVKTSRAGALSLGVIGAGSFASGVLLPRLKRMQSVRLASVCCSTGVSATAAARRFGFTSALTDAAGIIDDPSIQAVVIATRHGSHAALATAALAAGKHVFVEKPLALDSDSLSAVMDAARASGRVLQTGFNRRFSTHGLLLRDYFAGRGPVQILYRVNAGALQPNSWLVDPAVGGGRLVGEVCHFVDFCSFVAGDRPKRVTAVSAGGSDDDCTICVSYANGSTATIVFTSLGSGRLAKERCEVFGAGSAGVLDDYRCTECSGRLGRRRVSGRQDKGFDAELAAFVKACRAGGTLPITLDEQHAAMAVVFAAREAIASGEAVEL